MASVVTATTPPRNNLPPAVVLPDKIVHNSGRVIPGQFAGIMGAKKTADLIPLCHPLPLTSVEIAFEFTSESTMQIKATAKVFARTGVEMEALTAVSVAALTVYDMAKAVDRAMTVEQIRLESKAGGKSGDFRHPDTAVTSADPAGAS